VAEWRWECVTDDLLDGLPPDALRAVQQLAKELAVRESMVFLDRPGFTGDPPGLRTIQRGPMMLIYLRFEVGDEVYGMPFFPRATSGYAEYITAPARPHAGRPFPRRCAALPLTGLNTWQSLADTASSPPTKARPKGKALEAAIRTRRAALAQFLADDGADPERPELALIKIDRRRDFAHSLDDPKFAIRLGCADASRPELAAGLVRRTGAPSRRGR
jgi:hypothetical protein